MLPLIIGALEDQKDLQDQVSEGVAQSTALETAECPIEQGIDQAQLAEDKSTSKQ